MFSYVLFAFTISMYSSYCCLCVNHNIPVLNVLCCRDLRRRRKPKALQKNGYNKKSSLKKERGERGKVWFAASQCPGLLSKFTCVCVATSGGESSGPKEKVRVRAVRAKKQKKYTFGKKAKHNRQVSSMLFC